MVKEEGEGVVSWGPEFCLGEGVGEGACELGGEDEDGGELDEIEEMIESHEDLFDASSILRVTDLKFTDYMHLFFF